MVPPLPGTACDTLAVTVLGGDVVVGGQDADHALLVHRVSVKGGCAPPPAPSRLTGHTGQVTAMTPAPSGLVVSGGIDCQLQVWDVPQEDTSDTQTASVAACKVSAPLRALVWVVRPSVQDCMRAAASAPTPGYAAAMRAAGHRDKRWAVVLSRVRAQRAGKWQLGASTRSWV